MSELKQSSESSSDDFPTAGAKESPVRRLTDLVIEKFTLAFQKASNAAGGERITWEVFPMAAPNPMTPGQIMTGLAVFISIPTNVIGRHMTITTAVDGSMIEAAQEIVDDFVHEVLDSLLAARSEVVREEMREAAQAQPVGRQEGVPEGLIVPGR